MVNIKVRKVGEHSGFYREYFETVEVDGRKLKKKEMFILSKTTFRDRVDWHTTTKSGEPDGNLRDNITIVEI